MITAKRKRLRLTVSDDVCLHAYMTSWNRVYSSAFSGSLYGSGALKIACWFYIIAEMKPDFKEGKFTIELNPKKVADALGEDADSVEKVITAFCEADKESRSKRKEGAKLVREGQYQYTVVNGALYNEIRKREERREQNRIAQQRFREKKQGFNVEGQNVVRAAAKLDGQGKTQDAERTLELDEKLRELP